MSEAYFTRRPDVVRAVRWEGDNLEQVCALTGATPAQATWIQVNADGTLGVESSPSVFETIHLGEWTTGIGSINHTRWQRVEPAETHRYVVEES